MDQVSPSTRRAWIEIKAHPIKPAAALVALHPEGVDRNPVTFTATLPPSVALHPEGVDRNVQTVQRKSSIPVALHPEGVDRNLLLYHASPTSLSRPPPGGRG